MSTETSHGNISQNSPVVRLRRNTLNAGVRAGRVCCVAPFPGTERVVSASDNGSVIVWKLGTNEQQHCWFHEGATAVAVSPDGTIVVSGGSDCALQFWDAESGDHLSGPWELHKDRIWSITWSSGGSRIASCSADGNLIIWNARPELLGKTFLKPIQTGHGAVRAVAYCPKGDRVATGGNDRTIKIWDDAGLLQATLSGHAERVLSVAWAKDGSRVISGCLDGTARVWDILGQKLVCEIAAHTDAINSVAVSDHVFATASADHAIYLWNLKTHRRLNGSFELHKRDEPHCVALTADENTLIACTERSKVYTFDIGEIILGLEGRAGGRGGCKLLNIITTYVALTLLAGYI
jgi:WD40 repeat protein